MTRKKIIIANWKMYKTIPEAEAFLEGLLPLAQELPASIYLAVPFTAIYPLAERALGSAVVIGAQNMNDASEGAFTGEIAAKMLLDAGARFVILGHSERRRLFQESDALIHRKVQKALSAGLQPILCVGETQEERESGLAHEVVKRQLVDALQGISAKSAEELVIGYEPVWAIGTGLSATPELAEEMHHDIRTILSEIFDLEFAARMVILYGGSVNKSNAHVLIEQTDIDGFLVGGASLSLETFREIIQPVGQL